MQLSSMPPDDRGTMPLMRCRLAPVFADTSEGMTGDYVRLQKRHSSRRKFAPRQVEQGLKAGLPIVTDHDMPVAACGGIGRR